MCGQSVVPVCVDAALQTADPQDYTYDMHINA